MTDYGEPWERDDRGAVITRDGKSRMLEHPDRVIACVNACAVVADPQPGELAELREIHQKFRVTTAGLIFECEELRASRARLAKVASYIKEMRFTSDVMVDSSIAVTVVQEMSRRWLKASSDLDDALADLQPGDLDDAD